MIKFWENNTSEGALWLNTVELQTMCTSSHSLPFHHFIPLSLPLVCLHFIIYHCIQALVVTNKIPDTSGYLKQYSHLSLFACKFGNLKNTMKKACCFSSKK